MGYVEHIAEHVCFYAKDTWKLVQGFKEVWRRYPLCTSLSYAYGDPCPLLVTYFKRIWNSLIISMLVLLNKKQETKVGGNINSKYLWNLNSKTVKVT